MPEEIHMTQSWVIDTPPRLVHCSEYIVMMFLPLYHKVKMCLLKKIIRITKCFLESNLLIKRLLHRVTDVPFGRI